MIAIYEVNLEIAAPAAEAFSRWLPGHVAEVVALPGFIDAVIARVDDGNGETAAWSVRYRLDSHAALEQYLARHAGRMRADGQRRFADHMHASRRILTEVQHLSRA